MNEITISGFYDEISSALSTQIAILHELGETYMCPRNVDGKNIADYTFEEFKEKIFPVLKKEGVKFSSIGSPIGKVGIDDEEGFEKQKKQGVIPWNFVKEAFPEPSARTPLKEKPSIGSLPAGRRRRAWCC